MTTGVFESLFTGLQGTIESFVIDPRTGTPLTIIRLDDPWKIQVKWLLTGQIGVQLLNGTWEIQGILERFGPEPDIYVANPKIIPFSGDTYDEFLEPIAGLGVLEGMYRVAVMIRFRSDNGTLQPVTGYVDGPTVQFYKQT